MIEIICSGIGGQGVLVAGMVLADIAMEDGKNVSWYPSSVIVALSLKPEEADPLITSL